MAGGYSVGIASETKAFKQGIESGVIDPLEDAQKELEQLGRNKGPDQLERGLKEAQKATENLEDDTKKTARAIEREYRDAYRKVKESSDDGTGRMKEGVSEFKDEAISNFSEVTSSFSGDMTSAVDLIQGTLGGLASTSIPGVGLAAGAAAIGVGAVAAAFQANEEASERAAERAAEWADAYIEAGDRIVSASHVVAEVQAIATDPERYKTAEQNASDWGVTESTAMRAMAGDAVALAVVKETLNDRVREANELMSIQETQVDENAGAAYDLADAVERGQKAYAELNGDMEAGSKTAEQVSDALKGVVVDAGTAEKKVDEFGNALYTLPDGTEVVVDAKTGLAHQNVSRFKGDVNTIPRSVNTRVDVAVNSSAWDRWVNNRPQVLTTEIRVLTNHGRSIP